MELWITLNLPMYGAKDYKTVQNVEKIYEEAESVAQRLWDHIKES